jgi:hypothetical protein
MYLTGELRISQTKLLQSEATIKSAETEKNFANGMFKLKKAVGSDATNYQNQVIKRNH